MDHGEREHAVQAPDAVGHTLLVRVEHDLRAGAGAEPLARLLQPCAQRAEVADLAVEDCPDPSALVYHGLVTRSGKVDEAEAGAPNGDVGQGRRQA